MMVQMASSNIILQTIVEEDKRGQGDEFLYHGFYGAVAFWQFIFRGFSRKNRCGQHLVMGRVFLYYSGDHFCFAVAETQKICGAGVYSKKALLPSLFSKGVSYG